MEWTSVQRSEEKSHGLNKMSIKIRVDRQPAKIFNSRVVHRSFVHRSLAGSYKPANYRCQNRDPHLNRDQI